MIRLLLLAYPASFRRRYGEELIQLVAETGLGWTTAVDLIRSGLHERREAFRSAAAGGIGMIIGPAWRHPTGLAIIALAVLLPALLFVGGSLLAYQFGLDSVRAPMEAVNAWLATRHILDLYLVLSPVAALILAIAPLLRLEFRSAVSGREALAGMRLRAANLAAASVALAVGGVLAWHFAFEFLVDAGT